MRYWVEITSRPTLVYYRAQDGEPGGYGDAATFPALISVGILRRPLGGENASVGVTLDNARGQLTKLFSNPPLRAAATVWVDYGAPQQMLQAVITDIAMGATVVLTLET